MNCEAARDLLLEADLVELRGDGDGELARHLRMCAACGRRAQRILHQYAALQGALDRAGPPAVPADALRGPRSGRTGPVRRWTVAVPLALAASLAVWLLQRPRGLPAPAGGPAAPAALASFGRTGHAAAPLDVQVPPGRAVTVFQTDNPNIVVIWSF